MREIRASVEAAPYSHRNPFQDAERTGWKDAPLREYLLRRMVTLASENDLRVTDLLLQPRLIKDTCAMIIMGLRWRRGSDPPEMEMAPGDIPRELRDYRVKVKSLDGQTVRWKKGLEEVAGNSTIYDGVAHKATCANADGSPVRGVEEVTIDTEETEATLSLVEAWEVLRQKGKFCISVRGVPTEERGKVWRVEEIFPEPRPPSEEPTDRRTIRRGGAQVHAG